MLEGIGKKATALILERTNEYETDKIERRESPACNGDD